LDFYLYLDLFPVVQYTEPLGSEEKRRELFDRLNTINGVSVPDDVPDGRPSIPLSVFGSEKTIGRLQETFEWIIEEIKGHLIGWSLQGGASDCAELWMADSRLSRIQRCQLTGW